LGTLPCLTLHFGRYLETRPYMQLASPPPGGPTKVQVLKSEEKGSDVNLATVLLTDAFDKDFEQAVVISNDSDLVFPIRVVRSRFGLPVVVLFPCGGTRKPSYELSKVASASPLVSSAHLAAAQFPPIVTSASGKKIHKPPSW
jgi:hypothetical protein